MNRQLRWATNVAALMGGSSPNLYDRPGTSSRKALCTGTDTTWLCGKEDGTGGLVAIEIRRNDFITTDSVGSPSETWRDCRTFELYDAMMWNNAETGSGGTIGLPGTLNSTTNPHGFPNGVGIPTPIPYVLITAQNGYKEYQCFADPAGKFTLALQDRFGLSPAGSTNIGVYDAAGPTLIATVSTMIGPPGVKQYELTHPTARSTTFTVRIQQNATNSSRLTILGVNSVRLLEPTMSSAPGVVYTFDTYARTPNYFGNNDGSNDYAVHFADSAVTAGSVHGGETLGLITATLDGAAYTMGTRAVGSALVFHQESTITDPSVSHSCTVIAERDFSLDGRKKKQLTLTFSNPMKPFYSGMETSHLAFKRVSAPYAIADTTAGVGNGATVNDYNLGTPATVIQNDDTTGNVIEFYTSAPIDIPGFEQVIIGYDATAYNKIRAWAAKANTLPAGTYTWKQAVSYRASNQLLLNGNFSAGTLYWTGFGSTKTVSLGYARYTAAAMFANVSQTSVPFVAGKYYDVTIEIVDWMAGAVRVDFTGGTTVTSVMRPGATGVFTERMQAVSGNNSFAVLATGTGTANTYGFRCSVVGPFDTP